MSRTIITSLTTFFVVAILLLLGGASIKGFAFALVLGVLSGVYSTIFIAAPILADLTGEIKPKSTALHSFKRTAHVK
jgi:SecD/SecF fusion protein